MDFTAIKPYSSDKSSVQDTFFSLGSDCIVVRRFITSALEDGNIHLDQRKSETGEWEFHFGSYFDGNLALLVEEEDSDDPRASRSASRKEINVTIDGTEYTPALNHGYMLIAGPFDPDCTIAVMGFENVEEEAAAEETVAEETVAEEPAAEELVTKASLAEEPDFKESIAEEPDFKESIAEESAIEVSDIEEPAIEEPVNEEPVTEEPVTEESVTEEPVTEAPVTEEPVTEEPITEEPVIEEPVIESVIAEESPADDQEDEIRVVGSVFEGPISIVNIKSNEETEYTETEDDPDEGSENTDEDILDEDSDDGTGSDEEYEGSDEEYDDDDSDEEYEDEESEDDDEPDAGIAVAPVSSVSHIYEDAEILYSESKQRYVLKIARGSGAHAILPGGAEVFARTGAGAFKGYRMRIGEREYDLVVMNESALNDKTACCNAYMDTIGSFRGDCCYCVDVSHPEKSGTHGISKGTCFIDSETGYKWGKTSPGCYEFELENGSYNVYTISTSSEGQIMSEKSTQKVSSGYLRLFSGIDEFTHISITAADAVITESSSYITLTPDDKVVEAAYLYIPDDNKNNNPDKNDNIDTEDTLVAHDTRVDESKSTDNADKAFKAPQFEHITLPKSSSESGKVTDFVFDTFTEADGVIVKNVSDDDRYKISDAPAVSGNKPASETDKNRSDREAKNKSDSDLKVTTFSPSVQTYKKNTEHQNNTLKTKNTKKAAAAAGIAAGAAILGGIIKALTGRKK